MAEQRIVTVDSFRALDELAEQVCLNTTPGFQANQEFVKKAGMDHVIDALAATTLRVLGEDTPIKDFAVGLGTADGYAHIDEGFIGLAVHINRMPAEVRMAHLYEDGLEQRGTFTAAKHNLFECRPTGLRHMRVGASAVGAVTIFSEGNIEGLKPTVHQFKRLKPGPSFYRFTTNRSQRQSIPYTIEHARAQAKRCFDNAQPKPY